MSKLPNNLPETTAAIGVFDSGVGGLSILEKVHHLLPNENLLYLADSAHAPYGQKEEVFIQQRCDEIMRFFMAKQVKAVVLACNTATAAAIVKLRAEFSIPIIGIEPALKPAAEQSRSGIVGVLATAGTIDSAKFVNLKSQFSDRVEIITKACLGLVEEIEKPVLDRAATIDLLTRFTLPMLDKGADTLVLGCTHYPLIKNLITEVVGDKVKVMDTGFAVANELKRRLQENQIENQLGNSTEKRFLQFYSTGNILEQEKLFSRHWHKPFEILVP